MTHRTSRDLSHTAIVAIERGLRSELAMRLAGESPVSEMVHAVLAVMAAFLIWPATPPQQAIAWTVAISLSALLRALLRRRHRANGRDPDTVFRDIRVGVAVLTFSWGLGILFIGSQLPVELLALLAIMLAGIVAGATIALLADQVSYYILNGGLLLPLIVALRLNGHLHAHTVGTVLIALFGAAMLVYHRRAHRAFLTQIRTARELAETTARAQAARDEAEHMAAIAEATTDHVGIGTLDGRMRYINHAGRAMLGIGDHEDVTRLTFRDITPANVHYAVEREHLAAMIRDGAWRGDSLLQHRDGRVIPVSMVVIPHRDERGEVESISFVARDMTEHVAARKAMQAARDAAEQAAAAKSAFLANTSHEIRTPLNGILGMVELLLDTELTAAQRRSVELIASSGETLLATINDVLDLSKIEAGQMEMEHISFDLHHVVHSTVRLLISRAAAKNLELVSAVDDDVPERVMGDPHRLRQVLTNLVGNAIKFTATGEVVVSVRKAAENGHRVRVRIGVKDTGIGIAPEHVDRIFDPFRQVDASTTREYGGTGLGLSIARRLVTMMNGTLEVDSAPGRGSEFHFTADFERSREAADATPRATGSLRGVRTLVVDDHPTNRRVLCDMLRWAGSDVTDTTRVDLAVGLLQQAASEGRHFALVVSDVQMPGRDGFDLAAELRGDAHLRRTRIMLLTSAGRPGDAQRCRELGVAAYMQKPVSRVELVEAAVAALAEAGAERAHRPSLVTRQKLEETRIKLHILVAEDNPVNQEVAASLLRKRGHTVEVVGNGREAVDAVEAARRGHPFDLVLMDVQMPEQDGLSATKELRALGHRALPIVALTANVSTGERERCMAAGMSGYLAKPFKPHELYATVEGWSAETASSAAVGPDAAAPVDLAGFREMLDASGITEAGPKLIAAFLADAPPRIAAMRDAAAAGDLKALATHAHRVASAAGTIYARELSQLLRAAEDAAGEGNMESAVSFAARAEAELERVQAYLRANA